MASNYIGSYEEKIMKAVELIQSAAEDIKSRDKAGCLYAARLDVVLRIGKIMADISETEIRKEKKDEIQTEVKNS